MFTLKPGNCGLCAHFGQDHPDDNKLVQMRINGTAPEGYVDECGHPQHAASHLQVTPASGCDAFVPAKVA